MDSDQISFFSLVISIIAAVTAIASFWVTKKALTLEENRDYLYNRFLKCDLIKGLYINTSTDEIIYIFIILIANSSSSHKSISKTMLKVLYVDKDEIRRTVIFQHDPIIAKEYKLVDYDFAPPNIHLLPHETTTCGYIFRVTKKLIRENHIDIFKVVLEDNESNSMTVDCVLPTEYIYEDNKQ